MSREKNLQRAIVLSLLLTNVWCGAAYAADGTDGADGSAIVKTEKISDSGYIYDNTSDPTRNATDGADGSGTGNGGNGGAGGAGNLAYTAGGTVTNNIAITANGGNGGDGGIGMLGGNGGNIELSITVADADFSTNDITLTAKGGTGGAGGVGDIGGTSGQSGASGSAGITGLIITDGQPKTTITAKNLTIDAQGGAGVVGKLGMPGGSGSDGANGTGVVGSVGNAGGNGEKGDDGGNASNGGSGGHATAVGVAASGGTADITLASIAVTATGGAGGTGGNGGDSGGGGNGGNGADLDKGTPGTTGGAGGAGGEGGTAGRGGDGGNGGNARVMAVSVTGGTVNLTTASITATATGGNAGDGGNGGYSGNGGKGGNGGTGATGGNGGNGGNGGWCSDGPARAPGKGGNAEATGVYASGGIVNVTVNSIVANAAGGNKGAYGADGDSGRGGVGGTGGADGSGGSGTDGNNGKPGRKHPKPPGQYIETDEAKAYGIYAEQNAVINLYAKNTLDNIKIGAKAENAENLAAYAVYADNATVIFHNSADLNWDGSTTDNTVMTYLNNATLGFGGTAANRIVTGGTLELQGSNEFRVTTDLGSNGADKFTFDSLKAGSSTDTQYITVGYDKAFDGSDLTSISGNVVVLSIGNLNNQTLNFEGKASTLDSPLDRFTATPTVDVSGNDVKITQIDFGKNADGDASETVMTASDAKMALGSMWRMEGNNLMKRMGELRSDKEAAKGGVWARYYRGELSADSAYDRNFSQDYTAFQGGIDKVQDYKGGKLYTGIAINRIDSKAGYTMGSGDLSSTGVGLYASWLGSKGHYVDVIARGSKLANDFKLVDLSGNSAKADYDTWAYGISTEYGYRQQLNAGWFVEPQAELSLGRIGSVDYTTSSDVTIKQDSVNSAVVRLGFLGGKEFSIGGRTSNAYVKASALHDFGGNGGAMAYKGIDSRELEIGELTGTWYEIGLGANLGIAKNSNLYFDALKTFGGDLRTDWQFNAGLRFTF